MEARQLKCENRFHYVARGGSLVVAFLLCLVVFLLPLRATGSEVPPALAMANLPRLDQATNGNAPPLDDPYLLAPAEEADDASPYGLLRVERRMAAQERSEAGSIVLFGRRSSVVCHHV